MRSTIWCGDIKKKRGIVLEYHLTEIITLISAALGVGFSIGAVKKEKADKRLNSLYMLARSLALLFIAAIPLFMEAERLLLVITAAMLIVQLVDGFAGIYIKNRMRTFGPLIMAALHMICLCVYFQAKFW